MSKPHTNPTPHVVILSFWATYCQPCKKEIPALAKFIDGYGDKPIKAFLISIDKEGPSKVAPFVKEQKFSLPSLLDPYAKTAERYGVKSVPALFVIDTKGIVRYSAMGFDENADLSGKLKQVLDEIFSGVKPSVSKSVVIGEQVGVQKHSGSGRGEVDPSSVAPRERWQAIVRVECGQSVEEVADELSVSPEVIKEWYQQLKGAVLKMWDDGAK
jgi:peroxiredoxin